MSTSVYSQTKTSFNWSELPNIPDNVGFAGSFSGVSNNALIVTGGANFPDGGAPWTGSKKVWHDRIFALDNPKGEWKVVGQLPNSLGYGVSVTWKDDLIIIGGSNEDKHFSEVMVLHYNGSSIDFKKLPNLPEPIANSTGAILGNTLYILGGTSGHSSKESEKNFWALDLDDQQAEWKILDSWPGPSRMLAVAGTQNDALYLFSGAQLDNGQREYLIDAYKYTVKDGWTEIASLPKSIVAAPSPALTADPNNIVIFGGDDGTMALSDPKSHPGFSTDILSYRISTDAWDTIGKLPNLPPVTAPLITWEDKIVILGGEIRPSVRSTKVLFSDITTKSQK